MGKGRYFLKMVFYFELGLIGLIIDSGYCIEGCNIVEVECGEDGEILIGF